MSGVVPEEGKFHGKSRKGINHKRPKESLFPKPRHRCLQLQSELIPFSPGSRPEGNNSNHLIPHVCAHTHDKHCRVTRGTGTSAGFPGTNDIKDERYLCSLSSSAPRQGIFIYYCGSCYLADKWRYRRGKFTEEIACIISCTLPERFL